MIDFVTPEMKIYHEETFAPVVCIVRVKDVEEAIQVGNDTEYGLAGAVFTRNMAVAMDVARRLQSGSCHINGPTVQDEAHMPFGGMKASGYGRFGGHAAAVARGECAQRSSLRCDADVDRSGVLGIRHAAYAPHHGDGGHPHLGVLDDGLDHGGDVRVVLGV